MKPVAVPAHHAPEQPAILQRADQIAPGTGALAGRGQFLEVIHDRPPPDLAAKLELMELAQTTPPPAGGAAFDPQRAHLRIRPRRFHPLAEQFLGVARPAGRHHRGCGGANRP